MPQEVLDLQHQLDQTQAEYRCAVDNYDLLMEDLEEQLCSYEIKLDSLNILNHKLVRKIPKRQYKSMSISLTNKITLQSKAVDDRICTCLKSALEEYNGPEVIMTSGLRSWPSSSAHTKGKAIDWRWNPEIIYYLDSDEGKAWLSEHELDFYIENVRDKRFKDHPKYKYISGATGPHIHIFIKTCRKKKSI